MIIFISSIFNMLRAYSIINRLTNLRSVLYMSSSSKLIKAIARGFVLYKEYTSQHMPFSYYVSAVFEFFGAHSIYAQRFMFYLLFALMWVLIYRIYRKDFNSKALAFYPVLFTFGTIFVTALTILRTLQRPGCFPAGKQVPEYMSEMI